MPPSEVTTKTVRRDGDSLAESLQWSQFRTAFADALTKHSRIADSSRVDLRALAAAFWAWAAVLEHDASFEALDPVDHAHFAAGQLLARLLVHRPVLVPPLPAGAEAEVLTAAVLDRLSGWRRALGAPPFEAVPIDIGSARWSSFLENTAETPELAVAFLDEFTGREPEWRYPQLIAERPAMRRARRVARVAD